MLYIVSLEPLETRYTAQWQKWFNEEFPDSVEIPGDTLSELSNNKNFLDPFQTNIWKSEQIIKISNLFRENKIKEWDKFLFLDAWHYGIIALKYMSALSNTKVQMYGLWHAGSYDPYDLLGQLNLDNYFDDFESSIFKCLDKSFVATEFHKNLILNNYPNARVIVTGFPYKFEDLPKFDIQKENLILFPHRLSNEKQPNILKDLEPNLKKEGIKCIFCQETKLTKNEYHLLLAKSKMIFSASLQETWGLGCFEGLYYNSFPCVPDRLSYSEMYNPLFMYPSQWTSNWENYKKYKYALLNFIINRINNKQYLIYMKKNIELLKEKHCTIKNIKNEIGVYNV
jgi:hypothetical protein